MKYYLGIDIGGSSFKCGVIDESNNIVYQTSMSTNYDQTNEEALKTLSDLIDNAISKYEIISIGIGVPCVVNDGKITMAPNLPNWKNIDFETYIKTKYSIPFAIDNDANVAAFAELMEGNGKDLDNFVYITLGTGVGGAIVINKQIYRGNVGGAGEIGHIILDADNNDLSQPKYRQGVMETLVGKEGIVNSYIAYQKQAKERINIIDVMEISVKAHLDNGIAYKTLVEAGKYLGKGIATINHILDVGNFIIGGGISQCDILIKSAKRSAKEHTLPSVSKPKIQIAKYIQNTGIVGAALLGKIRGKIRLDTLKRPQKTMKIDKFVRGLTGTNISKNKNNSKK